MIFKNISKKLVAVIILSMIGTFNAIYLTIGAYKIKAAEVFGGGDLPTSFCDFSSTFSCSTIFSFDFSWMFGVPFSLLAAFIYPIIIIIAILGLVGVIKNHYKILLGISIGGLLFNGYIIVNESIVGVYCLICLACTFIILTIGIMSYLEIIKENKKQKNKKIFSKIKSIFSKK